MTPLEQAEATIRRLRERIEDLESDLRLARRESDIDSAGSESHMLADRLSLEPQVAWLLAALKGAGDRGLSHEFILAHMPGNGLVDLAERSDKTTQVAVYKIRKRLGKTAVLRLSKYGYRLSPEGLSAVRHALAGEPVVTPPWRRNKRTQARLFDVETVSWIRATVKSWDDIRAAAVEHGCSESLIHAIRERRLYTDVA